MAKPPTKPYKTIGFVLFNDFTALDVFGPLEAFFCATKRGDYEYKVVLLAEQQQMYVAESGAQVMADYAFTNAPTLDTLVVPGGCGSRDRQNQAAICPWLKQSAAHIRRVVSVCTGAYLLAEAGLLDNLPVTTHWQHTDDLQAKYPKVQLQAEALFIQHAHISTSAGISSGIDLALKLIEDDCGADVATQVARLLVLHYRRAGDQAQYSEPLRFQQQANSAFASLTGWVMDHLAENLCAARLAERSGMSERNLYRKFKQHLGVSPAKYIELLRLDYARQLLIQKDWPNKRVALACGYPQVDVFRRAFERRFGVSPKHYRHNFS